MATHIHGVKSLSVETRTAILLVNLMYFILACLSQTISLTCPSLHEGSITMFSCSIPTSMCFHENVFFDFQRGNEVPRRLCLTSASGSCDQPPVGGMNCSCVSSNSSTNEYQFNFLGDKATYEGGTLKCNVDCEPIPAGATCQSISYEQATSSSLKPTEYTSDSTSSSTSPSPSNETEVLDQKNPPAPNHV